MHLTTIFNRVTKYKPFVVECVDLVERDSEPAIEITMRAREIGQSIGVDEVQWQKGHKYQTVVYQIDEGRKRLLWVGPDRTAKTLLRFFVFWVKIAVDSCSSSAAICGRPT